MPTMYVDNGEIKVVDLIDGTDSVHLDGTNAYIEWGLGSTAPVKGNTDIETTTSEARVLATATQPSADINQWVAAITADAGKTITECALFDNVSAGVMVIRGTFTGIPVVLNDQIEFTVSLEQT